MMWLPVWWSTRYPVFASALTNFLAETTGSLGTYFYQFLVDRRLDWLIVLPETD